MEHGETHGHDRTHAPFAALGALLLLPLAALPVAVRAQSTPNPRATTAVASVDSACMASPDPFPAGDSIHPLFTRSERGMVGGTVFLTVAATFADRPLRGALRASPDHQATGEGRLFGVARTAGSPGVFLGSLTLYGVGRVMGQQGVADAGLHSTEAIVVSGAVTQLFKGLVGRERPYASDGQSGRFASGRGFTDGRYASFPSGHTSASFAAAAVLTSEVARHYPRGGWRLRAVGALAYGSAALIGVSRIYHDAHWASDVVAGAGLGTLSGMVLSRQWHTPGRCQRTVERWLLGAPNGDCRPAPQSTGSTR